VSQEVVKCITQKFIPINQECYFDVYELYDTKGEQNGNDLPSNNRSEELAKTIGKDLVEKISNAKVFMIGAGAIGCELLKNFAMVGVGTGPNGKIIVTDPDVIEVSNLNR